MSGNNQNFELLTLKEIFDNGRRRFRIPDYQRGYSWETVQRKDLMDDIEYIIAGEYSYRHYTGTIVASRNDDYDINGGFQTFDIVDGQQRSTSLVILLSILADQLKAPNTANGYSRDFLVNTFIGEGMKRGNTIRKFISGAEQDKIFEKLVLSDGAFDGVVSSKSDQNLVNAWNEFKAWLEQTEYSPQDITKCVLEYMGFLFYAPENDSEIGIMFEVINNRGKSLSQLEKIKNYLIYYAQKNDISDLEDAVKNRWPQILSRLNDVNLTSNDDENSFLRNCWIVFQDTNKSKSYHVYDNLKELWPPDNKDNWSVLKNFVFFLDHASLTYLKFLGLREVSKEEKKWLERIKYHPQTASVIPLIIAIFDKIQEEADREKLLELLEKLNFRFYGTGIANRADTGQGDLFNYAHSLYNYYGQNDDEGGERIDGDWLYQRLSAFVGNHANDSAFVQHLTLDKDESGNYYHWQGLKFFLASYEEFLRSENKESIDLSRLMSIRDKNTPNDFYHREHIWASSDFRYTAKDDEPIMNKRRLGNFILLKEGQNIKVSNSPIEKKVDKYWEDRKNDPNTLMMRKLKHLYDQALEEEGNWSRRTKNYWLNVYTRFLDAHEELMINFGLERWRVKEIKNNHTSVTINSMTDQNEVYHFND